MSWLIRLYPPAWRRRYGRELAELLATQPVSWHTALDLVAGAVDAWLHPQSSTAVVAADQEGHTPMPSEMLKLRSADPVVSYSAADARKALGVTIGGTLAIVLLLGWAIVAFGKNAYLEALLAVSWIFPMLFSQRYTDWKERSGRVQAVLIGVPTVVLLVIVLAVASLNN